MSEREQSAKRWNHLSGDEGSVTGEVLKTVLGVKTVKALGLFALGTAYFATPLALGISHRIANSIEVTTEADLDKAETKVELELIKFEQGNAFNSTELEYSALTTAEDVEYVIDYHVNLGLTKVDAINPNPRVNKQLEGIAQGRVDVPFSAVSQTVNEETGKIDIELDASQFEASLNWKPGSPDIKKYTINKDDEKNFDDQSGFKDTADNVKAEIKRLINWDAPKNAYTKIDNDLNRTLDLTTLAAFGETCAPELDKQIRVQAKNTVRSAAHALGKSDDIGEITVSDSPIDWPTFEAELNNDQLLVNDFEVDQQTCKINSEFTSSTSLQSQESQAAQKEINNG